MTPLRCDSTGFAARKISLFFFAGHPVIDVAPGDSLRSWSSCTPIVSTLCSIDCCPREISSQQSSLSRETISRQRPGSAARFLCTGPPTVLAAYLLRPALPRVRPAALSVPDLFRPRCRPASSAPSTASISTHDSDPAAIIKIPGTPHHAAAHADALDLGGSRPPLPPLLFI